MRINKFTRILPIVLINGVFFYAIGKKALQKKAFVSKPKALKTTVKTASVKKNVRGSGGVEWLIDYVGDIPFHTIKDIESRIQGAFAKAEGLIDYFRNIILSAGERAEFLKAFLQQMPSFIQGITFKESSFKLTHPDPEEPDAAVEITFEFSQYLDHFDGIKIDVNLEILPSAFRTPLNSAVEQEMQELFGGQLRESETDDIGKVSLMTSPVAECYLRSGILAKDLITKKMTLEAYRGHLVQLFFRLMHDRSIQTLEDAIKGVPELFQNFTQNIGMGGIRFDTYLSAAFSKFLSVKSQEVDDISPFGKHDIQSVIDGIASIILHLGRDYSNAKLEERKAIVSAVSGRLERFLKRYQWYLQAKPVIVKSLKPFEDGILLPIIGSTLNSLLDQLDRRMSRGPGDLDIEKLEVHDWLAPAKEGSWFEPFPEPSQLVARE